MLKWLDVHVHCAIALAPGTMSTYSGPKQGAAVAATAPVVVVAAHGAAEQEFAPVGTVVAHNGAAEQEFAPVGTVVEANATAAPMAVQPEVVQAVSTEPAAATPAPGAIAGGAQRVDPGPVHPAVSSPTG